MEKFWRSLLPGTAARAKCGFLIVSAAKLFGLRTSRKVSETLSGRPDSTRLVLVLQDPKPEDAEAR